MAHEKMIYTIKRSESEETYSSTSEFGYPQEHQGNLKLDLTQAAKERLLPAGVATSASVSGHKK